MYSWGLRILDDYSDFAWRWRFWRSALGPGCSEGESSTAGPAHLCILYTADLACVLGEAPSDGYEREARGQHDEDSLEQM